MSLSFLSSANSFRNSSVVATALSEDPAHPIEWIMDQIKTKTHRSKVGWTFSNTFNNLLDFSEGGVGRVANLGTGTTYATGALAATQIASAMNAAGVDVKALSPSWWWKADALLATTPNGTRLSTLVDSSGNARDLSLSAGLGATFDTQFVLNGLPGLHFDATVTGGYTRATTWATFFGAAAGTGFVIYRDQGGASIVQMVGDTNNKAGCSLTTSPALRAFNNDGVVDNADKSSSPNAGHIGTFTLGGGNISSGVDNTNTASLTNAVTGSTSGAGNIMVGASLAGGGTYYLYEIILFTTALTEENRRRISKYLAVKYGITDGSTAPSWTNTYTCTYSSTTFLYTIARSAGAATFSILGATGTNVAGYEGLKDIGFAATDRTGATTYDSALASYSSRHYIDLDLGSALAVANIRLLNHNFTSAAVVTLYYGSSAGVFTSAGVLAVAAGGSTPLLSLDIASQTKQYWRVVIDDLTNTAGYFEIGVLCGGTIVTPAQDFSAGGMSKTLHDLSIVSVADQGSNSATRKTAPLGWSLPFNAMTDADVTLWMALFSDAPKGVSFFVKFETSGTAYTYYVYRTEDPSFQRTPDSLSTENRWNMTLMITESI